MKKSEQEIAVAGISSMLHSRIRCIRALRNKAEILDRTFNSLQLKANSRAASKMMYPSAQTTMIPSRPEMPSSAVSEINSSRNAWVTLIPVQAKAARTKKAISFLLFKKCSQNTLLPTHISLRMWSSWISLIKPVTVGRSSKFLLHPVKPGTQVNTNRNAINSFIHITLFFSNYIMATEGIQA